MLDLSAYILENNLSQKEEKILQKIYFGRDASNSGKVRVIVSKTCQDFLWSIWTVIKEAQGDDFGNYGIDRYKRCKKIWSC